MAVFFVVFTSVLLASVTATPSKLNLCTREGRFAFPGDCGAYITCDSKNGVLEETRKVCPRGGFNEQTGACDVEMKGCTSRQARTQKRSPDFDSQCESGSSFICLDCLTLAACVGGKAYEDPCNVGEYCTSSRDMFTGASCHHEEPEECKCTNKTPFQADFYTDKKFRECSNERKGENVKELRLFECSEGMVFDEEKQECGYSDGSLRCERMGVFPTYDNCNVYYKCISHKSGFVREKKYCPEGLMLNERKGHCEDPCQWADKVFTCTEEGRFANETDCTRYFYCSADGEGFKQKSEECPGGAHWHQNSDGKDGACIPKELSTCQPKEKTKCKVPADQCSSEGSVGSSSKEESTDLTTQQSVLDSTMSVEDSTQLDDSMNTLFLFS